MINESFEIEAIDTKQKIMLFIDYKWKRPLKLEKWFDNNQPTFKVRKYRRGLLGEQELIGSEIMYVKDFEVEWEKYHKENFLIRAFKSGKRVYVFTGI
tara:strand:+ start:409 stop:702 length:294 start_codon:yes stop_codon:yes gene_type:complete